MDVLILGGTRFVGRAILEHTLAAGHEVTLFNRGSHRDAFPEVAHIAGDRSNDDDVAKLRGDWGCIIDVNAYHPAEVRRVLDVVADSANHYVYISTISVYAEALPPGADEAAPLIAVDEDVPPDDPNAYGGLKVLCERELRRRLDSKLTVLRPTVVAGPHDYTDRFTWYVRRIAAGGTMPSPPRLEQPVQLIDARDLGAFAAHIVEHRILGTYNAAGPSQPTTVGGLIETVSGALGTTVELGAPRDDLPLTLPSDRSEDGFFSVSIAAAVQAGLRHRSLADTARDTRQWDIGRGETLLRSGP